VYRGAMRNDLRNLMTAEESLFADSGHYSDDLEALGLTTGGARSITVEAISGSGLRARAKWGVGTARAFRVGECVLWFGDSSLAHAEAPEGEPRCEHPRRPLWRFGAYGAPTWER
jgi:hypothetical protein